MIIRAGETAKRLGACFGVDRLLPFPIPVWIADVNCEFEAYATEVLQLSSADGLGVAADYAHLANGQKVSAIDIFFRGNGYRSPTPMKFTDEMGLYTQPGQHQI